MIIRFLVTLASLAMPELAAFPLYFDFGSDIERSLEASFAVVQRVISAYVLILISERETGPMRAEAPAKMPCKLIDCRAPF